MFKVNNKATKTTSLANEASIAYFEHISHLCCSVSIVNFEQVNAGWVTGLKQDLYMLGIPSFAISG